jgi:hypothetical protein
VSDHDRRPEPHATGFSTRAIGVESGPEDIEDLQADFTDALAAARAAVLALGAV